MARTRAEEAADALAVIAMSKGEGAFLGGRRELVQRLGVSVGTLHEALRLLQSTGEITVRRGPGGGVYAAVDTALAELLRDARTAADVEPDFDEAVAVIDALAPLLFQGAVDGMDAVVAERLRRGLNGLRSADGTRAVVRSSLGLFATIVTISPPGILRGVAGAVLRVQLRTLKNVRDDAGDSELVELHVAAAGHLVERLVARDVTGALAVRRSPDFRALFARVAAEG